MNIVSFYASLLATLFFFLSVRTIRLRRIFKIGVGDAGNQQLLRAMRVHANCSEYAPFCLLLIYFVQNAGANPIVIHSLGMGLLIGRLSHAYGVSQLKENFKFRVTGMVLTFTVLLLSAGYLLLSSLNLI